MSEPRRRFDADPWLQATRIGLFAAQGILLALLLFWASANIRSVPPDSRAVVHSFGTPTRVAGPGLLLAWPQPAERVNFVPAADRQLDRIIETLQPLPGGYGRLAIHSDADVRDNRNLLLTGDLGVMRMEVSVTFVIDDPIAYDLEAAHVAPALDRFVVAALTSLCAGRELDLLIAMRPGTRTDASSGSSLALAALRSDLVAAVNRQLDRLAAGRPHGGLGVRLTRADLTAILPIEVKVAYDQVLAEQQNAAQMVAAAHAYAEKARQAAEQSAGARLRDAEASAVERVSRARSATASIFAIARAGGSVDSATQAAWQVYRERIVRIFQNGGEVTMVDTRGGTRLILPGPGR